METPIITLTTDWGNRDFFAGMVKGKLYSRIPNVQVVDITYGIEPNDLVYANFVIKNACLAFPKGTIHIIDVDSVESMTQPFVVVEYQEQFFICTDNGLPYSVFGDNYTSVTQIDVPQESDFYTFASYDLFCKVAVMLAQGCPLKEIGSPRNHLCKRNILGYIETNSSLKVCIIYIDSYGNAYLNITYNEFEQIRKNRPFSLTVRDAKTSCVSKGYEPEENNAEQRANFVLTVSSTGHLEVALHHTSAEMLLGLKVGERLLIEFKNL